MTKFILDDAINMAEFASKMEALAPLLTAKNVKNLISGVDEAKTIIDSKNDILAHAKATEKAQGELDKRVTAVEKTESDNLAKSTAISQELAATTQARIQAERDGESAAQAKILLAEATEKAKTAEKRAGDKAIILDAKIKEAETKTAELSEAIAAYNDALANLKAIKVA